MTSRCLSLYIVIALCVHLAHAATEPGVSATTGVSPTDEGASKPTTLDPGGTEVVDPTTVGTTQANEALTVVTDAPTASTPAEVSEGCLCDLTPGFCDIGCCCDTADCGVANLSTVFTGCPQETISGVCIEKWLIFRANVDSSLVSVTDSMFCVQSEDDAPQTFQVIPQYPTLGNSYHFSPPAPTSSSYSRPFYRVDDAIQTFFSNSSVRGLLRQPSSGVGAGFCINRNPTRFLRSLSLSCTRVLTPQTCTTDPNLSAHSYFSGLSLIKIPIGETAPASDFLIQVTPLSEWPAPDQLNNSCVNVVKNVEFVIRYTGRGELTYATVNIVLADVEPNELLLQTHSVTFQLDTPSPTSGRLTPAVGLRVGSPVTGRFDGKVKTLTMLSMSPSGECSTDPTRRAPILFAHNTITGCRFSSSLSNCSELQAQMYGILLGLATPDEIAMNSGSELSWTRVITQECPVSMQGNCESGCLLPNSLSIRVLWARQGLLRLPQSYILGAKYLFKCKNFKCPLSSPLTLTTEVTFADTTLYPKPPRGSPQPHWKFPFGFFTRGTAELDGHVVINSGDTKRVTWGLMLFTVLLLTGLEFFR